MKTNYHYGIFNRTLVILIMYQETVKNDLQYSLTHMIIS